MLLRRLAAPLLALGLATGLTPVVTASAAPPIKARPDAVTVKQGQQKVVRVLANDRVGRKPKARLRIVRKPKAVAAKFNKRKRLVVRAKPVAKPGTYRIRYRVTDFRGRKSVSVVRVTVKRLPPKKVTPAPAANTLHARVAALQVAPERRTGYDRNAFKHWNAGANPTDGCDTRREVLIAEAVVAPLVGARCAFTGGKWFSYYDGVETTDSSKFDIDHLVPLAEAWDSGAYAWDATRREAFANDLGDPRSLIAVSAASNRSKGDRDPAEWMPPAAEAHCRYLTEWVAVKTRWSLSVDPVEKEFLTNRSGRCANVKVAVTVVR